MTTNDLHGKRRNRSEATRRMVVAAMLSAITAVLVFTPIGMILLPPPLPAITMMHIPVIFAALVEGPVVGLTVGLVFGLSSLIRSWGSGMVGLTLFFRNPLVSVLPRLLIPMAALGVYLLWKKLFKAKPVLDQIGAGVAAAFGALSNTVGCLGMILLLYGKDLNELLNGIIAAGKASSAYTDQAAAWLVAAVGLPNGITEIIVAAVLVPILKTAVDALQRRSGRKAAGLAQKERNE